MCVTVYLTAKAEGSKMKSYIVFKGAVRECRTLYEEVKGRCIIMSSANGWMNTEQILDWLNKVVGSLPFRQRMLVWDTYACNMDHRVTSDMKRKKINCVNIPGGCTKHIQALDVS